MLIKLAMEKQIFTLDLTKYNNIKLAKIENNLALIFNGPTNTNFIKVPLNVNVTKQGSILEFFVTDNKYDSIFFNFKNSIKNFTQKSTLFKKKLRISGLGFKITNTKNTIAFKLGYSHLISISTPKSITKFSPRKKKVKIESFDKIKLGNFIQKVYKLRKSDAYKGKGFSFWNVKQTLKEIKKK